MVDIPYIVKINNEEIMFQTYFWIDGPKLEISDSHTLIWYDSEESVETWFLVPKSSDSLISNKVTMRDFILNNGTFICTRTSDSDFNDLLDIKLIKDFSIYTLPEEGIYLNS